MKNTVSLIVCTLILSAAHPAYSTDCEPSGSRNGESLFKKHCAGCHHDIDKLKRVQDVVYTMRNPPAVMPKFDEEKISAQGAAAIARYIHNEPEIQPVPSAAKPATKKRQNQKKAAPLPAVQSAPTRSL